MAWGVAAAACAMGTAIAGLASAQSPRAVCMLAEAMVASVDQHLGEWDKQIEFSVDRSLNCSTFLELVYVSRDRIHEELTLLKGNFSAQEEFVKAQEGEDSSSTSWAMTFMSTAASLVSAHMHIHGVLAADRPECYSENLQLLFLMSLRRLRVLLQAQLRHLWVIFQGTPLLFRHGAGRWLQDVVDLWDADLRTFESVMQTWRPSDEELCQEPDNAEAERCKALKADGAIEGPPRRPGPPLPPFAAKEADGIVLSTLEVLRRDTFEEWDQRKPLLRALLRHMLPRDGGSVADFCAGGGFTADFLNDTGLLTAFAFDAAPSIRLLTSGRVEYAAFYSEPVSLWRTFDVLLCLTASGDLANATRPEEAWVQVWQNVDRHAEQGAILACGAPGAEVREQALAANALSAPSLPLDEEVTAQLGQAAELLDDLCVFRRRGPPAAESGDEL